MKLVHWPLTGVLQPAQGPPRCTKCNNTPINGQLLSSFCRAMRCISAAYVVMRYVSVCVCVSVTFVSCVKTNKDIIEIFSPSGSHTVLVFPTN